ALVLAVPVSSAGAKTSKPKRCEPGRFLLVRAAPLEGADAIMVNQRTVEIVDVCKPKRARFKGNRRFTKITVRWPSCNGIAGRARLYPAIAAPACTRMEGTFTAVRSGMKVALTAASSSGGEACV